MTEFGNGEGICFVTVFKIKKRQKEAVAGQPLFAIQEIVPDLGACEANHANGPLFFMPR